MKVYARKGQHFERHRSKLVSVCGRSTLANSKAASFCTVVAGTRWIIRLGGYIRLLVQRDLRCYKGTIALILKRKMVYYGASRVARVKVRKSVQRVGEDLLPVGLVDR